MSLLTKLPQSRIKKQDVQYYDYITITLLQAIQGEMKHYELSQKDTGGQTFEQRSKNTSKDVEYVNKIRISHTKHTYHHTRSLHQQLHDPFHRLHQTLSLDCQNHKDTMLLLPSWIMVVPTQHSSFLVIPQSPAQESQSSIISTSISGLGSLKGSYQTETCASHHTLGKPSKQNYKSIAIYLLHFTLRRMGLRNEATNG
jgi:hypothetical protein